jgi:hypothetical protein
MTVGSSARLVLAALLASTGCGASSPASPSPPPGPITGLSCGVERWSVKTLSDPDAATIDPSRVQPTTIKDLNLVTGHCGGGPDRRTFAEEFQVYEVIGRITLVRLEDDRDFHIALADADEPAYTIVTEIADPMCRGVVSSPFLSLFGEVKTKFDGIRAGRSLASLAGTKVRARGVGFFDFNHNQTGRSQSCIELHPITAIDVVQ